MEKVTFTFKNPNKRNNSFLKFTTQGFAASLFSTSPTSATSNQIVLTSDFASFNCEIHPDKTTTVQITCYTS